MMMFSIKMVLYYKEIRDRSLEGQYFPLQYQRYVYCCLLQMVQGDVEMVRGVVEMVLVDVKMVLQDVEMVSEDVDMVLCRDVLQKVEMIF